MKKMFYSEKTKNYNNKEQVGCFQNSKRKLWNLKILIKNNSMKKFHQFIQIYKALKFTNKFQSDSEIAKSVKS